MNVESPPIADDLGDVGNSKNHFYDLQTRSLHDKLRARPLNPTCRVSGCPVTLLEQRNAMGGARRGE